MRQDLTRYGVEEARTPQDVDRLLGPDSGAVLMIVNSVCGCAAGGARPAIGFALQHAVRPSKVVPFLPAATKLRWLTCAPGCPITRLPLRRWRCSRMECRSTCCKIGRASCRER